MSGQKTYKVVSPFLGSGNIVLKFDEEIGEKGFVPGDCPKRLSSGHVVEVLKEKEEVKSETSKKKGWFNKGK